MLKRQQINCCATFYNVSIVDTVLQQKRAAAYGCELRWFT